MAMIKDHDYVTVLNWVCPHCQKFNNRKTTIGRWPHSRTLICQNCAMQYHPGSAINTKYEGSDLVSLDGEPK